MGEWVEVRSLMVEFLKNKALSMPEEEAYCASPTASVDDILELLSTGEGELTTTEMTLLLSAESDIRNKALHELRGEKTSSELSRRKHPHLRGWGKTHPNYSPDWTPNCHCHREAEINK